MIGFRSGIYQIGLTLLVIGQTGTVGVGGEQKIVHVIYDERDVMPARGLNWFINPSVSLIDVMRATKA